MALGEGTSDLLRLVMRRGLALTAMGALLGTAAALMLTRLLLNMLYGIPAWRATRTDPARVLRN